MADARQQAAKNFAEYWKDKGYEKGESQPFWLSLLRDVYGVEHPEQFIEFEDQVHLDNTSFIDGMIPSTKVMIEQKGRGKDLGKAIRQSDGSLLTPFQQAKRYIVELPVDQHPRYVITCNFAEFWVYDMNKPGGDPEIILLENLDKEYYRLQFLVESGNEHIKREMEVSIAAGEIVGKLYDAFAKQYAEPDSEHALHSLNVLCVRLVFCLYAENSGIFGHYGMFHDYMETFDTRQMRKALVELFHVLDTPDNERDPYLKDDNPKLAEFPYVNGGLFSDEDIEIPPFTEEIKELLLERASAGFNWSEISPTIFGAVFESTLNPETRRSGGMHYTSLENIHKVIDPLFLDDLNQEFDEIRALTVERTRKRKLEDFQKKVASLCFLDPACGSGNFLTESYLSLRRMENDVLRERLHGQMSFSFEEASPIQVSLEQFYGIEINDFAVTVAKTALWIAESQMMQETESIVMMHLDFLPLKSYMNIIEGNALRINWEDVVPSQRLNYIMGNPPFVGKKEQTNEQKEEIKSLIKESTRTGVLDYVCGWFYMAAKYMDRYPNVKTAFVATDSLCQGEHVPALWKVIVQDYNTHIAFAYKTFKWSNEAVERAEVYCIIVGISNNKTNIEDKYRIYSNASVKQATHINPYLIDAPDIWLVAGNNQISGYSKINYGSMPIDDGHLILTEDEYKDAIKKEPNISKYLKKYAGADELLKGHIRYCIWLKDASRKDIISSKFLADRVSACKEFRLKSKREATRKLAETPELFGEIRQPDGDMIVIPKVSSKHRDYVPIMLVGSGEYIINGSALVIPDGNLYELGILSSGIHNIWLRAIAETWGHSYQYSTDIYNNFPFPPNENYRAQIESAAQNMLDIRASHKDLTLADMYSPKLGILSDLLTAHQQIDKIVWRAYGFIKMDENKRMRWFTNSESLAELMKMYQKLIEQKAGQKTNEK